MIHRTAPACQTPDWQQQLATAFDQVDELFDYLRIDPSQLPAAAAAARLFPLRVPRAYAARMEPGNPKDPLLLQVLPTGRELLRQPGDSKDPVADHASAVGPGTLHKYQGRVLLITTGACGVNCRYCFRRHYPYTDESACRDNWSRALDYLWRETAVSEVILSGGDPLALSDHRLAQLVGALSAIPHLQRLRIHTKLPVMIPERLSNQLIRCLSATRLQPILVLHVNHAREIGGALRTRLAALRAAGTTLLNQSVLLRDVNNSTESQYDLSQSLFSAGVLPYYLHLLDRVEGAAHFDVPLAEALELHREMRRLLPGYLVPRLVREEPGKNAKTIVA